MNKEKGFTLIELMVTITIVGILSATALPFYQTWMERARGAEAAIMMKQILDAEIAYFLENGDKFVPTVGAEDLLFPGKGEIDPFEKLRLDSATAALKIDIPTGHNLDFTLAASEDPDMGKYVVVTIVSTPQMKILTGGYTTIIGIVNEDGEIQIYQE